MQKTQAVILWDFCGFWVVCVCLFGFFIVTLLSTGHLFLLSDADMTGLGTTGHSNSAVLKNNPPPKILILNLHRFPAFSWTSSRKCCVSTTRRVVRGRSCFGPGTWHRSRNTQSSFKTCLCFKCQVELGTGCFRAPKYFITDDRVVQMQQIKAVFSKQAVLERARGRGRDAIGAYTALSCGRDLPAASTCKRPKWFMQWQNVSQPLVFIWVHCAAECLHLWWDVQGKCLVGQCREVMVQ